MLAAVVAAAAIIAAVVTAVVAATFFAVVAPADAFSLRLPSFFFLPLVSAVPVFVVGAAVSFPELFFALLLFVFVFHVLLFSKTK